MRKYIKLILFLLLFFSSSGAFSQVEKNLDMSFNSTKVDLGVIKEEDGSVTIPFSFKNIGQTPIIINTVSTSCGCTTTSYPREPIMAGATAIIEVTYDPLGRPGFFDKKIYIMSGNRRKHNVLTITGEVEERPKGVSDAYPYSLGNSILASSSFIEFGQIPIGYSHTLSLDIYNNSDKEVVISTPKVSDMAEFSYYIAQPKLKPKEATQLIVTIDINNSIICSLYSEKIPIFIDGKLTPSSEIKVNGISIPDISKIEIKSGEHTPAVYLPDVYHHFLVVYQNQNPTREFIIENEGQGELEIKQIIVSDKDKIGCYMKSYKITPMSSEVIIVQFKAGEDIGRFSGTVNIITNDPSFPLQEIRIAANVKEGSGE
ncbi:MAG: DUF1573 domain-containing protein [Rikenellaceae bacterium]